MRFPLWLRPRRFQLRLRTLLLLVTLIAVACAVYALERVGSQRRLKETVKLIGGKVAYDWETDPWRILITRPSYANHAAFGEPNYYPAPSLLIYSGTPWASGPPGPQWLRAKLGDEWFQDIVCISIMRSASDPLLRQIGECRSLRGLTIWRSPEISDAGIGSLANLKALEELRLSASNVTDAGLSGSRGTGIAARSRFGENAHHRPVFAHLESLRQARGTGFNAQRHFRRFRQRGSACCAVSNG